MVTVKCCSTLSATKSTYLRKRFIAVMAWLLALRGCSQSFPVAQSSAPNMKRLPVRSPTSRCPQSLRNYTWYGAMLSVAVSGVGVFERVRNALSWRSCLSPEARSRP